MQVIIIGRGHSGTRIIGETLYESGFVSGKLNGSADMIPGRHMYDAIQYFGKLVPFSESHNWDFHRVLNTAAPMAYRRGVNRYLAQLPQAPDLFWKLPESTLALPWLVQMFPDAYYIHWVRDGRDNILGEHRTDYLDHWAIPADYHPKGRLYNAAISWRYHEALVDATPKPRNWLKIRYEDFVLNQPREVAKIAAYLERKIVNVDVYLGRVGLWQNTDADLTECIEIMRPYLELHGYVEVMV
jgi:hypothetical protein